MSKRYSKKSAARPSAQRRPAPKSQEQKPSESPGSVASLYPWFAVVAALFGAALYLNTLGHQYCLDDFSVIKDNWVVKGGLKNLSTIFSTEYRFGAWNSPGSLYRPLTLAMFAAEWSVAPDQPFLGHLMNVVFYALSGAVMWVAWRRILAGYSPVLPALAVLFFLAHPVHTEVVANIKSRDEIVSLLLTHLALLGIWRYFDRQKTTWLLGALALYGLALFTKESVITFLAVIPLCIWFFTDKSLTRNFSISALFLIPAIFYLAVRHNVLSAQSSKEVYSVLDNFIVGAQSKADQLASALMMCGRYLFALAVPYQQVSDLGYPQMKPVGFGDWRALLSLAAYAGMGVWALMNLRRKHFLSFAILFYLATFSLFSNVLLIIGTSYGERLLYGPSLGFALALSWMVVKMSGVDLREKTWPKGPRAQVLYGVGGIILAVYAAGAISRNPAWYDSYSLYAADIPKSPDCAKLNYHYGLELAKKGIDEDAGKVIDKDYVEKAIEAYSNAIALYPTYHDAFGSRGLAYFRLQDYDKAFTDYQESLKHRPNDARVLSNLGYIYFMRQDVAKAEEVYRKAVKSDPRFVDARRNLGAVLAMRKQFEEAIGHWKEALQYDPGNPTLTFYIGSAYRDMGRMEEAQPWLDKAYQLDPSLKK